MKTIPKRSDILAKLILPKENWSEVEEALFGPVDLYNVETADAERLRLSAIQQSLRYHSEKNSFYRSVCKYRKFRVQDVKTIQDLAEVPLIPDAIFKGWRGPSEFVQWLQGLGPDDLAYPSVHDQSSFDSIMEELHKNGITVTYSSGTSGRFTFVPRDQLTWSRACYAIAAMTFQLAPSLLDALGSPENRNIILLGPDPNRTFIFLSRASAVGFSLFPDVNFHAAIDRKFSTEVLRISQGNARGMREKILAGFMRRMGKRESEKANKRIIALMRDLERQGKGGVIAGPPSWIFRIVSEIQDSIGSLSLGDRWFIMPGGGWKLVEPTSVQAKEFREQVSKILGVPDSNIRDMYGMTECNVIFPECEGHYKHIPSTLLQPFVLDEAFDTLPYGRTGRFAFIDPLAKSYPGFLITGDRARLLEHCPVCGRHGPVLDPEIARMPGIDDRGCANLVGNYVQGEASRR